MKIVPADELVVKAEYLCYVQVDTCWYWNQHLQHHVITVPTRKILHPRLELNAITDFNAKSKIIFNSTQAKKIISRHSIFLTESDYYKIL